MPNDPYAPSYPSSSYGSGYSGSTYDSYRRDREWRDIDREQRDIERERDRLEQERRNYEEQRRIEEQERRQREAERQRQQQMSCPSGFSPSENKCSAEERRRGCKDMRLPNGLGCVRR